MIVGKNIFYTMIVSFQVASIRPKNSRRLYKNFKGMMVSLNNVFVLILYGGWEAILQWFWKR